MIEKFTLRSGSDTAATFENLYNFLTENAVPEYFDSVEKSSDNKSIYCKISGKTFITFAEQMVNSTYPKYGCIYLSDNTFYRIKIASDGAGYVYKAYKCKNGFFLSFYRDYSYNYYFLEPLLAFTKDNLGNTVVIFSDNVESISSENTIKAVSPNSAAAKSYAVNTAVSSLTSLCPIVVSDEEAYTPNAFVLPYAQNRSQNIFEVDGVKYFSNGQWCIRDE